MGAIGASVGKGGHNRLADVTEIQRLLNLVPVSKGGASPPFFTFGVCTPDVSAAILRFQKLQVPAFADGRIDPGGPTLAKLNAMAAAPGPAPGAATGSLSDVTRARSIAGVWLAAVEPSITGFIFSVSHGLSSSQAPSLAFIEDAFHKHFKLILDISKKDADHPNVKVFDPTTDTTFLPVIRATFRNIVATVSNPARFDLVTTATATADGAVLADGTTVAAGYVKVAGTGNVNISPEFNSPTRGPNCQAAIVVHESEHTVDALSGDNATTHISEWETVDPPILAKFGLTRYDRQTPEQAIHNPSAYASFAAHVSHGKDERFGDGRRTE